MLPDDWTPHRRDDGELLGWIRPDGDEWVAIDVLGRPLSAPVEWLAAEDALERAGLGRFADVWMLEEDGVPPQRVRFVEVVPPVDGGRGRIVVKADDLGDVQRPPAERRVLPWPAPDGLRPQRPGDPDGRTL